MAHLMKLSEVEWGSKNHRCFEVDFNPIRKDSHRGTHQFPITKRDYFVPGALWTEPSFSIWGSGSATAGTPPEIDALLQATGLAYANSPGVSDTYTADGALGTNQVAVNVDTYIGDGLKVDSDNCVFGATLTMRPGEPVRWDFRGAGTYVAPTEAAGSAALATSAHPVACKGLTMTLATDTLVIKEYIARLGNQNSSPNYDICGTHGVASPELTDQDVTAEMLVVLPTFATENYFTNFTTPLKVAFSGVVGATAGNILTITCDYYQYDYALEDVNGVLCARLFLEMSQTEAHTQLTLVYT